MRSPIRAATLLLIAVVVGACSGSGATQAPTVPPTPVATPAPTASPDACAPGTAALLTSGKLTIGTDNPAYPPYFDTDPADKAWELGNPTNGKGFEAAFAYALAAKLGFAKDAVAWTALKYDLAYGPGPKPFDIYLAQISFKPERAQNADLTDGYYFVNQAVVALKGTPAANAKTVADLAKLKIGAALGTTSYDTITNVIKPTQEPGVVDSNDVAIQQLKNKQLDAIVVDLPTAYYIANVQITDGSATIVGQFPSPTGAEAEHYSVVLDKGSAYTACVNAAIAAMKADGSLDAITKEWLADKLNAPVIQP